MDESGVSSCVEGVLPSPFKCHCNEGYRKRSRDNTEEEKKAMRRSRKKRKRKMKLKELKGEVDIQKTLKESAVMNCKKYAGMSRTYWERWQWELQERRKLMIAEKVARRSLPPLVERVLPCIDPSMLKDPIIDGKSKETYVGRGSFGLVRLCLFRDMKVAVKEFLPRTVRDDVTNEATILASLSHPYLPCLLGVCLKNSPLRIVMQFHESGGQATTLFLELRDKKINSSEVAFQFCIQLVEAIRYLHQEAEILHNDVTTNNIVIENNDHIVLIDFGKATRLSEGRHYRLGEMEQQEYIRKYPHLAPEVVCGQQRQSVYSDVYAVGFVLRQVYDHSNISQPLKTSLKSLAEKCGSLQFFSRPKSIAALKYLQGVTI